jgi:hypothetical protein
MQVIKWWPPLQMHTPSQPTWLAYS